MNTQLRKQQQLRCSGLIMQLEAIRFLVRQGLSLRGHRDQDGNFYQLLLRAWADDDIVNELITPMGHNVLRKILARVRSGEPAWYALIADEATDVTYAEQLNVSVRYVDEDCGNP